MILKIELENFYSIKEKVRIDFRAGNINTSTSRELKWNVIDWKGVSVLKTVGLFGPNASGKSNIIKAISNCCRFIIDSHNYNEGMSFGFQPFKFDGWSDKPSRFLIDFVCEDVEYEYSFSLTREAILTESLYYYPVGRKAKIFTREGEKYSFGVGVITKPKDVVFNTSSKNLFLSRASSMNREVARTLYRYFFNQFAIGILDAKKLSTYEEFMKYKKVVLTALEVCDSDIVNIEFRKEQMPIPELTSFGDDEINVKLVDVLDIKTEHKGQKGVYFDLDYEESNGTRKLFQILIRLIDVARNGKSLMMDEFDLGLHTRLADFILDLIHASNYGQLLFATHNTNLIDVKRLRKDQIVFVNKKEDGATEVYSLFDYKDFRENMDAEKGYLQGRFDAVPYIDSSVSTLKNLLEVD